MAAGVVGVEGHQYTCTVFGSSAAPDSFMLGSGHRAQLCRLQVEWRAITEGEHKN